MQLLFIQTWETVQFSKANSFLIMLLTWFENFEYRNISKTCFVHTANIQGMSRIHQIYMAMEEKRKDLASIRRSHNKKLFYTSLLSI